MCVSELASVTVEATRLLQKEKIKSGVVFTTRNGNPVNRSNIWVEMKKVIKTIALLSIFEYTKCNRVAQSLFGIGDQAETCAQLFYVKERFYGFEKTIDLR